MRDQRLWSVQECADIFAESLNSLSKDLVNQGEGGILVWDKVNELCCEIFNILREKSLAIYFEDSQFRRNGTFNFIVSKINVDKRSRVR